MFYALYNILGTIVLIAGLPLLPAARARWARRRFSSLASRRLRRRGRSRERAYRSAAHTLSRAENIAHDIHRDRAGAREAQRRRRRVRAGAARSSVDRPPRAPRLQAGGADSHRNRVVAEPAAPLPSPRRPDAAAQRPAVAALVPPLLFAARAFLRGRRAAERDRHAVRGGRRADQAPRSEERRVGKE